MVSVNLSRLFSRVDNLGELSVLVSSLTQLKADISRYLHDTPSADDIVLARQKGGALVELQPKDIDSLQDEVSLFVSSHKSWSPSSSAGHDEHRNSFLQGGDGGGGDGGGGGESEPKGVLVAFDPHAIDDDVVSSLEKELSTCDGPCHVVLLRRGCVNHPTSEENKARFARLLKLLWSTPLLRVLEVMMDLPLLWFVALCDEAAKSKTLEALNLGGNGVWGTDNESAYRAAGKMFRENTSILHAIVWHMPWELLKSAAYHPTLQTIMLVAV